LIPDDQLHDAKDQLLPAPADGGGAALNGSRASACAHGARDLLGLHRPSHKARQPQDQGPQSRRSGAGKA